MDTGDGKCIEMSYVALWWIWSASLSRLNCFYVTSWFKRKSNVSGTSALGAHQNMIKFF
ncbi:unnamed protein product [Nesidiocoris tenuis]|uniref:Uncharacterized protein n=1 Tax=Nesidiocoris tenuis TaxID=355587 RepID=A0A6H5FUA1_9HEMI|nr:unnamed protein product [Nesidiocoris tenuis]